MNLAQVRKEVGFGLQEFAASDGSRSPQLLNRHIFNEVNELCTKLYPYYTREDATLAVGVPEYCQPDCLWVTSTYTPNSDQSNFNVLTYSTPEQMDQRFGSTWRDPAVWQTGPPLIYISLGTNRFRVYPVPDAVYTLTIEGFYAPNEIWDSNLAADAQDEAECPLPTWAGQIVVYGAQIRRMNELLPPNMERRMSMTLPLYKKARAGLERQAAQSNPALRAATSMYPYQGGCGWYGGGW